MDLDAWQSSGVDLGRVRRLAVGFAIACALCGGAAFALVRLAGDAHGAAAEEEETYVTLATATATATEVPAPAPVPSAPAPPAAPAPAAPARRRLADVASIPATAPREGEPVAGNGASASDDPYAGSGDGSGAPGGTGASPPAPPQAPPPPPPVVTATAARPPRAPAGPGALPDAATPPQAVANPQPAYPEDARRQSIEATVTVKFVVTESGEVTAVQIVRGHPLFDAAVLAAVRTWRYRPAVHEGRPIRVYRVAKIPFRIRT